MSRFRLDKRNAKVLGVCAGIAAVTGVDAMWVRAAAVLAMLLGSGVPVIAYVVIAMVADADGQPAAD